MDASDTITSGNVLCVAGSIDDEYMDTVDTKTEIVTYVSNSNSLDEHKSVLTLFWRSTDNAISRLGYPAYALG